MKKSLMAVAGMMVVLAMVVPASAQRSGQIKVRVPFNFVVENDRLKAGDYTIERIADGRLRLRNEDGSVSTIFLAIPAQESATPEQAHFIFNHYGSEYFLAKIWLPGQQVGWELLKGKAEMEVAKKKSAPVETADLIAR
jgi:hypothetical protein